MTDFNLAAFTDRLSSMPERAAVTEPAEYSSYLQEQVFDVLARGREVNLAALDFDALTMRDLTSEMYRTRLAANADKWAKLFNQLLKGLPATALTRPTFF